MKTLTVQFTWNELEVTQDELMNNINEALGYTPTMIEVQIIDDQVVSPNYKYIDVWGKGSH